MQPQEPGLAPAPAWTPRPDSHVQGPRAAQSLSLVPWEVSAAISFFTIYSQSVQSTWKVCSKKLNVELPQDPATPHLGTHPGELKAGIQTDPCTPVFTGVLFTSAEKKKQPSVHHQMSG